MCVTTAGIRALVYSTSSNSEHQLHIIYVIFDHPSRNSSKCKLPRERACFQPNLLSGRPTVLQHGTGSHHACDACRGHGMKDDIWTYGTAKLLLLMACKEMVQRLEGTGVTCLTAWPGIAGQQSHSLHKMLACCLLMALAVVLGLEENCW